MNLYGRACVKLAVPRTLPNLERQHVLDTDEAAAVLEQLASAAEEIAELKWELDMLVAKYEPDGEVSTAAKVLEERARAEKAEAERDDAVTWRRAAKEWAKTMEYAAQCERLAEAAREVLDYENQPRREALSNLRAVLGELFAHTLPLVSPDAIRAEREGDAS